MALLKMKLKPLAAGYSATPGQEFIATKLDGGASRYRRDILGAAAAVSVAWSTDAAGYAYLQAFYRQTGANGLPFLIDLPLEGPSCAEHTAHFAEPLKLTEKDGPIYRVSAGIEVTPLPVDDAADLSIIDTYEAA